MKSKKEIIKSPDYWLTKIQNELFRELTDYMNKNNLNQNDIAKKMNVSRGYINQVLNGNFNFTLKKLIELSLAMNKIPSISFDKIKIDNLNGHSGKLPDVKAEINKKKLIKISKEAV